MSLEEFKCVLFAVKTANKNGVAVDESLVKELLKNIDRLSASKNRRILLADYHFFYSNTFKLDKGVIYYEKDQKKGLEFYHQGYVFTPSGLQFLRPSRLDVCDYHQYIPP